MPKDFCDADVVMQSGNNDVGLIELENGSKVGGARWLGVMSDALILF